MDPLNLLRELYGEEPIRKILNSGFDSPDKIAAATAESLSFFAGVQEALARQIIESAETALAQPREASERRESPAPSGRATQPRELPRAAAAAGTARKHDSAKSRAPKAEALEEQLVPRSELMDERPLLDVGGLLKSLAKEPSPKELRSDFDFLEEVGLTDAEAGFLEGISSPWSGGAAKERVSPAAPGSQITFEPPAIRSVPLEFAPISSWSPEDEPNPVPRLVRAAELGPDPDAVEPAMTWSEPEPAASLRETATTLSEPMPALALDEPGPTFSLYEPFAFHEPEPAASELVGTTKAFFRTEVIEEEPVVAAPDRLPPQLAKTAKASSKGIGTATGPVEDHAPSTLSKPSFWKFGK